MTKINKFSLKKDYIENEKFFLRCIIPDLKYSSYAKCKFFIKKSKVISKNSQQKIDKRYIIHKKYCL